VLFQKKTLYPPHGRLLKIPGGGGLKNQNLEPKYEAELEFLGGRKVQNKNLP